MDDDVSSLSFEKPYSRRAREKPIASEKFVDRTTQKDYNQNEQDNESCVTGQGEHEKENRSPKFDIASVADDTDEADEVLRRGFKEQVYDIYRYLPPTTQVVLMSATLPLTVLASSSFTTSAASTLPGTT